MGLTKGSHIFSKMILRSLLFRPLRLVLNASGMAAALAILINGSFWTDVIDFMMDRQFYEMRREVLTVSLLHPKKHSGYRSEANYCPDAAVPCGHSGGKVAFQVSYKNKTLPWGVKVELLRGFAGQEWCGGCEPPYHNFFSWQDKKLAEMTSVAPWTWSAQTEGYGYGSSAGGQYDALEFVIRVTFPEGTVQWANGGSIWGYYKVDVPPPQFDFSWTPYKIPPSKGCQCRSFKSGN